MIPTRRSGPQLLLAATLGLTWLPLGMAQSLDSASPAPRAWGPPPASPEAVSPTLPAFDPPSTLGIPVSGQTSLEPGPRLLQEPRSPGAPAHFDPFEGEVWWSIRDLRLRGIGLDLQWSRTYRSRWAGGSALGPGWDHSYNVWVEAADASSSSTPSVLRLHDGQASTERYVLGAGGLYQCPGRWREGRFDADGRFVLVFADGGRWIFQSLSTKPSSGRLESIVDRNGNTLRLDYGEMGQLVQVVDTLGHVLSLEYDDLGRLSSVADFSGREVRYEYYGDGDPDGSAGDLRSVRTPLVTGTPHGNDFPAGKTTEYRYSSGHADPRLNHNLLEVVDPAGLVVLGNRYHDTTDPGHPQFDRLVEQHLGHPDHPWILTRVLQSRERLPSNRGVAVRTILNDPCGHVSEWAFDARGRCVRRREFTGQARPDEATTDTENRPVGPLRASDPSFFETRWRHDGQDRLLRCERPGGSFTRWTYAQGGGPRTWGNVRSVHLHTGGHVPGGAPRVISEQYEYLSTYGGLNFVRQWTDATGHVREYGYDERGNRVHSSAMPGLEEDLAYDARGRLVRRVHPARQGRRRADDYVYSPDTGFLERFVVDVGGLELTQRYTHDPLGRVLEAFDPCGESRRFHHDALDHLVRVESRQLRIGRLRLRTITDHFHDARDLLVRVEQTTHDEAGQPADLPILSRSIAYDVLGAPIREVQLVAQGEKVVTEYEVDPCGRRVLTRYPEAVAGRQDSNVLRERHDERGLLFQHIAGEGGPEQSTTRFDYDLDGRLARTVEGLEGSPRTTQQVWDAFGRLVMRGDAMGNVDELHHDALGRLLQRLRWGELRDLPGEAENCRLSEELFVRDALGRVLDWRSAHFDPHGGGMVGDGWRSFLFEYDGFGPPVRITDDRGGVTQYSFDGADRGTSAVDALGNRLDLQLDPCSQVLSRTELHRSDLGGESQTVRTTMVYDERGRLQRVIDALGRTTRYDYDSRGKLVLMTDALGQQTRWIHDGLGRSTHTVHDMDGDGADPSDPEDVVLERRYDASSRLVAQVDGLGQMTAMDYDGRGQRTRTTFADGSFEIAQYDAHGDAVTQSDANGTRLDSSFDALGRAVSVVLRPGGGVSADTSFERFEYDGLSRMVRAEDDDSVVLRQFDSLSNLQREEQDGLVWGLSHDGMGNRVGVSYPGGLVVRESYDARQRLKMVETDQVLSSWSYLGSRVQARQIPVLGGAETRYQFDGVLRVAELQASLNGVDLLHRLLGHDEVGRRVLVQELAPSGDRDEHGYDALNRLVDSRRLDVTGLLVRSSQYQLDAAFNREAVTGSVDPGSYQRDPGDREVHQYTGTPFDTRVYDQAGNLIQRGDQSFEYDARHRVVRFEDAATAQVIHYRYDALGRRVERRQGTRGTRSLYLGQQVAEIRDLSGQVMEELVRGGPSGPVLVRLLGGKPLYSIFDEEGSLRALLSDEGTVVERYDYEDAGRPVFMDPAGQVLPGSAFDQEWLFLGQRFDPDTGWYERGTRRYDPRAGRYLDRIMHSGRTGEHLGNGFGPGFPRSSQAQARRLASFDARQQEGSLQRSYTVPGSRVGFDPQPEPPARGISAAFLAPGSRVGFNPQPEPPARGISAAFLAPGSRVGFNPQPEPPARGIGAAFLAPGSRVGFNPQPEPPARGIGAAFLAPGSRVGFNPQPEPPARGIGAAFLAPGSRVGFNPQPEPPAGAIGASFLAPGSRVGFNPQPEPPAGAISAAFLNPGALVGFNPQPEPPAFGGLWFDSP